MSGSDSITNAITAAMTAALTSLLIIPSTSFPAQTVTVSCYSATTSSG